MKRFLALALLSTALILWTSELFPARLFNGTTDVITMSGSGVLNITNVMSISAWVNVTAFPAIQGIVAKWDDGPPAAHFQYILLWINNQINGSSGDGNGGISGCNCAPAPSINTWYHVGMYVASDKSTHCVFSGAACCTAASAFFPTSNGTNVTVGAFYGGSPTIKGALGGRIAEVGIWNVTLTANEFSSLGAGVPPNRIRAESLVGYWPLYGYSSPETDLSGQLTVGTLTGTAFGNHSPGSKPGGAIELGR